MDELKRFEPFWGSWYITDELGEGGYGKVYKIERNEFGNTYYAALKHLRVPQSQSEVKSIMADGMDEKSVEKYFESMVGDIIGEFVLMSKLKGHSHIVSYEDHKVVKADNLISWDVFIRMELLTNLLDYIRTRDITKKDVIKLGIDMCKALELCQKYNIIHRDVKPENIFISDSGEYKLGDFGIARQAEKTMSGMSKKGTFTYIAPEVYKGEAYGSSVDIYSLGIVMYRLLNNNRVPFMPPYPKLITHNDREIALVKRVSGQTIPNPVNADGRLAEIVLKACAYSSKDRYSSPLQMRQELEAILYNDVEGKIIYPKGDKADIKSVQYIDTGEEGPETQIEPTAEDTYSSAISMGIKEEDETQTMGVSSVVFDNTFEEKDKVTEKNEIIEKNEDYRNEDYTNKEEKKNKLPLILACVSAIVFISVVVGVIITSKGRKPTTEEVTIDFEALRNDTTKEPTTMRVVETTTEITTIEVIAIIPTVQEVTTQEEIKNENLTSVQTQPAEEDHYVAKTSGTAQNTASEDVDKQKASQEAARQEAARQEAARQEAARQEAARQEAARQEAARQEAARQEAARQEAARQEVARQEAAEAARQEVAEEAARQEAARQAAAEEAARQAAAEEAARQAVAEQSNTDGAPEIFVGFD